MDVYGIITKKKLGGELSREEIFRLGSGYVKGEIPDYQIAALLMAIYFNGMTDSETADLTEAITESGDRIDLSAFGDLTADKHSTGGVGDKTTLIVAPLAASLGCKVAKMSGRGLGHTGGTVDKLESIPGYRTSLSPEEFYSQVEAYGISVIGQSGNLAPLDKKLYALRDVTATVDSIPLIVSSVMGKKLAAGSKTIVLDVKYGSGSFMKSAEDAELLAEKMVAIGKRCGRRVTAIISDMDTPLGKNIGNALEVAEATELLKGDGPKDLREICIELASEMASSALGITKDEAKVRVVESLDSGKAYAKFLEWIEAQGGDTKVALDTSLLPKAAYTLDVRAREDGYISKVNAEALGTVALNLGAGRRTKEDVIDPAAGIILKKKTGDKIEKGDVIATLFTNRADTLTSANDAFLNAITVTADEPKARPLIHRIIR